MDQTTQDTGVLSCPVCGGLDHHSLVSARDVPIIACLFAFSYEQALASPRGDIELVVCDDCGHVYNRLFAEDKLTYTGAYENTLGFSRRHRAYVETKVENLIVQHDLRNKVVVEIGCGAAHMLRHLCRAGANRGIGYDPSRESVPPEPVGPGSVEIIGASFDDVNLDTKIDVVCSQHVLEHLPHPVDTLRKARDLLVWGGLALIEVPNADSIFRDMNIWDLTYEHISYFSPRSLNRALTDGGFSILRMDTGFGDQYLVAEAEAADFPEPDASQEIPAPDIISTFPERYGQAIAAWQRRLEEWRADSRKVVLWGAGTKAVAFLNILAPAGAEQIEYVIDINPRKAGRFIPGTGQEIKEPVFLKRYRPDVVIVMNPEYVDEIEAQVRALSLGCEVMTATGTALSVQSK